MEPAEPEIELTEIPQKRRIGISGILSSLGGILFLAAFFLPLFNTAAIFSDWEQEEISFLSIVFDHAEEELEDESDRAKWRTTKEIVATLGLDQYINEISATENEEEKQKVIDKHNFSLFQITRAVWLVNRSREKLTLDKEKRTTFLWILFSLVWIAFMAGMAALLPILRRIPPLNGFQMSWNGTVGLILFVVSLLLLMGTNRVDYVSSIRVSYVKALPAFAFIGGGFFIWISAFAGLNRSNWWKGPLYGVFLLAFGAGTFLATSSIFLD